MKKVMIRIKGTQGLGDNKQVIEFATEGTLGEADGKFVLSYYDDSVVDGSRIKTTLTAFEDKSVVLDRTGAIKSRLLIEKGVRNNCFYSVPEGSLTLGIYGKEIANSLRPDGGKIKMVYTLDTDLKLISENTVEISVMER